MFGKSKKNRQQKRKVKQVMKGELVDLDVELISVLVDDMKPANGKGFVRKDAQGVSYVCKGNSAKFKADDKGYLYVTVYEPGTKDSQDDHMTADQIEKACETFSKKGMVSKNDVNHNLSPVDEIFIAQNYILKTADKEHFPDTKIGSWVQVLKCDVSGSIWGKVKANKFNGVSLFGKAVDVDDTAKLDAVKAELIELKKLLKKSGNDEAVKEIDARLEDIEQGVKNDEMDKLVASVSSLAKSVETAVTRVVAKGLQGEPGANSEEDSEFSILGQKVTVKSEFKELYKAIGTTDEPQKLGILTAPEQTQFIDTVIEMPEDDTFSDVSMIPMGKDEKIDKGLISDIILKNQTDGAPTVQAVATGEISCPSQILLGKLSLDRETVEFYTEKYGEEAFGAYVNQKIINGVRKQLKILLFAGDRASGTAAIKGLDGIVTILTATDVLNTLTWENRLETALLTFTDDMLDESESLVIYVGPKDMISIRSAANVKVNNQQGRLVIDGKTVYFDDIPIKKRRIPVNHFVIGLAKFIIIGLRTDVEMFKEFKDDWKWYWNFRLRAGITVVPGDFVKSFELIDPA